MENKNCPSCKKILPLADFGLLKRKHKDGTVVIAPRSWCKKCCWADEVKRRRRPEVIEYMKARRQRDMARDIKYKIQSRIYRWRQTPGSDLTVDYLVTLWNKQKGLCYYTGQEMNQCSKGITKCSLSLDRVDPNKGYIQGNVVWCCNYVNTMKGKHTEEEFYTVIRHILQYKGQDERSS